MTTPRKVHGADVSHWQGTLDLKKAKAAGLQFLYHKATEHQSYVDDEYAARRKQAKEAGLPFGGYHFARPDSSANDAVLEARHFWNTTKPVAGDLVPALDLEVAGPNLEQWAKTFMNEIKRLMKAAGLEGNPIHYGPNDFGSDYDYLRWVPRYNNTNTPPTVPWDIWQFSNGQYGVPNSFPGLGNVDLNTFAPGVRLEQIILSKVDKVPDKEEENPPVTITKGTKETPTANKLTAALRGEVGYREGYNNTNKYAALAGHMNNQPWCATFLEGMTNKIGLKNLIPSGQSMASCDLLFQSFQKRGRWSEYPAVGAFFFLGKSGSGSVVNGKSVDLYHVGYVYAFDKDNIYTIEGNTNDDGSSNGNGVYARVRPRRNSSVHCYAYPDYPEGIISADPKWKDKGPKPDKDEDDTPPAKESTKLYVMHCSMQFSDPTAQMTHDVDKIFAHAVAKKAAWITGTEATPSKARGDTLKVLLAKAGSENGYRFYMERGNDSWIAVRKDLIKGKKWETFYKKVIDGKAGQHGDKGVISVTFDTHELGEISVMAGHYLTKGRPTTDPDYNYRLEDNKKYAAAIDARAKELAKGASIVFYGGDQNIDDKKDDTFLGGNFVSSMDELKKWENTGHGPIDVTARWRGDKRVKAVRVRAYPDREFFLHTDHFMIDAVFEVQHVKAA